MRVAVVGLATSHPFTDAYVLRALERVELVVVEPDDARAERYLRENDATRVVSVEAAVAAGVDVATVTTRPDATASSVRALLSAGVPVFCNKPAVVTAAQLDALDEAVDVAPDRFFTGSVLRLAPRVRELAELVATGDSPPLLARATVHHDIGGYLEPERRWQDDPAVGGGTLLSLGLHGIEMLDTVLGPGLAPVGGTSAALHHTSTLSEDCGLMLLRAPSGAAAAIEVIGAATEEQYAVEVHTASTTLRAVVPDPAVCAAEPGRDGRWAQLTELGYVDTMRAVLALAGGAAPPWGWARSREVMRAHLAGVRMARAAWTGASTIR